MRGFLNSIAGKFIGIIGAGVSGRSAARKLKELGSKVLLSDKNRILRKGSLREMGIEWEEGRHERVLEADMVVFSPSVPINASISRKIKQVKIPSIGTLELGYRLTNGFYIAITGTNGKSTTTSLINRMIPDSKLAGNIGIPLVEYAFSGKNFYVIEVSSFQLMRIDLFKPDIALLLNIAPDHLDWHRDMREYIEAKFRLFKNQDASNIAILNYDDEIIMENAGKIKAKKFFVSLRKEVEGGYLKNDKLVLRTGDSEIELMSVSEIPLKGEHNLYNVLFSSLAAYLVHGNIEFILKGLKDFDTGPHRIEFIGEIKGIKFYNDSKSTNVHSTYWALKRFGESKRIILVLGGKEKNLDYTSLIPLVKERVKLLILIGETKERLYRVFKDIVETVKVSGLNDIVQIALDMGQDGDILLFSPGSSSFDMFKNYKERGDEFRRAVKSYMEL